jgi:hypothetical protein
MWTEREKALVAKFRKMAEKNKKFVESCVDSFSEKDRVNQPALTLIIGGASDPIPRKKAS